MHYAYKIREWDRVEEWAREQKSILIESSETLVHQAARRQMAKRRLQPEAMSSL